MIRGNLRDHQLKAGWKILVDISGELTYRRLVRRRLASKPPEGEEALRQAPRGNSVK